jgi:outer membrane protein W
LIYWRIEKMKKNRIINLVLPLLIAFLFITSNSFAQRWFGSATYQMGFPAGDTKDFTGKTSFSGFGMDFRYNFQKNASVGFSFGWNLFHERVSETVYINTNNPGAITGTQDRYVNSLPIMANLHYYIGNRGKIRPYVGVNLGGYYLLQRFSIGVSTFEEDSWEWGVAPEVGVIIPINRELGFIVNGKYNYTFTGESLLSGDINHSYMGLNIGFVWRQ